MSRKACVAGVLSLALVACGSLPRAGAEPSGPKSAAAPSPASLTLDERALMASKIYRLISTYFPDLSQSQFDLAYAAYLKRVLELGDRRAFDLASMEFVAGMHDGHTWFYDQWLEDNHGQAVGFVAYPLDGKWAVVRSQLDSIKVGDVLVSIDGTAMADFFEHNRKYVSASSARDAGVSFFDTPPIFPNRFQLTLGDGRKVVIDRKNDKKKPPPPERTEGRWLSSAPAPNAASSVAYIKIPTFRGIETQAQALEFLRRFHDAKAVILDVRGNPGLGLARTLQTALMAKPYRTWSMSSTMRGGLLLRNYDSADPARSTMTMGDATVSPGEPVYTGRLFLLVNRGCTCACEDFVMPFKFSQRATLIGENTAGTYSFTRFTAFDNGMLLNVSAIRHTFPDGSPFEGVGIAPDVAVPTTAGELKEGRDTVLQRAVELANK